MSETFRIGILGSGRMADAFAQSIANVDGAVVHAVGSRTQSGADAFASAHKLPHSYGSYQRLLEDEEIDLVYIATPHPQHRENALASLDAGKAVLCEKPFALNADQAREMIERARANNCFLMEAMWTRFLPSIAKLRQLLEDEVIGEVQLLTGGGAFMSAFDPEHYLLNKELGGGVLLDAGVYLVSMSSMILGTPASVSAAGTIGPSGVDDNDAMLLSHASGANALLYVSLQTQSPPDLRVYGTRGEIHLHAPVFAPAVLTLRLFGREEKVFELPFTGNGYHYQVEEVLRCLRAGQLESSFMPHSETVSILETMDTVRAQIGMSYPSELRSS